jgi:hypothetical protein
MTAMTQTPSSSPASLLDGECLDRAHDGTDPRSYRRTGSRDSGQQTEAATSIWRKNVNQIVPRRLKVALLAVVCALVIGLALSAQDDNNTSSPVAATPAPEAAGLSSNGDKPTRPGSAAVYERIESLTDCNALQAEFDQADENNKIQSGEGDLTMMKVTTSYMEAGRSHARDRLLRLRPDRSCPDAPPCVPKKPPIRFARLISGARRGCLEKLLREAKAALAQPERRPRVGTLAPFGPSEKLNPRLERFRLTPGAIFLLFRKNSPIGPYA